MTMSHGKYRQIRSEALLDHVFIHEFSMFIFTLI